MNNGAFGENFPYSNFHDLNMDWIIKIAKDFLDQYTGIQDTITTGLTEITEKGEEIEALLQEWYSTHSADIETQLQDAITEFNTEAQNIINQLIQTIPSDYTALSTAVANLRATLFNVENGYITNAGVYTEASGFYCTPMIPLHMVKGVTFEDTQISYHIHFFDSSFAQTRVYASDNWNTFSLIPESSSEKYARIWSQASSAQAFANNIKIEWIEDRPDFIFPAIWFNGFLSNAGTFSYSAFHSVSSLIPIELIESFTVMTGKTVNIHYFDKNKTQLSRASLTEGTYNKITYPNKTAYIRIWTKESNYNNIDNTVVLKYGNDKTQTLVVFGDSWSDNDPAHTTYRKWTTHIKESNKFKLYNYSQNGSTVMGDTGVYGQNGNIQGQVNQFMSDQIDKVDTFIIFAGLNDFRSGTEWGYVAVKLESFINTLKSAYPSARVIYIANHQVFITKEQLTYFNNIAYFMRRVDRIEAFTTFGWLGANMYLDDNAHPTNEGYKCIFSNILSILLGGTIYYVTNTYMPTPAPGGLSIRIVERWTDGYPIYSTKFTAYSEAMNRTHTFSITTSEQKLCASVPFIMQALKTDNINVKTAILEDTTDETFDTQYKLNTTNTILLRTPDTNAGTYMTESWT